MVAATPDADSGTLTPPSTREGNLLPLESSMANQKKPWKQRHPAQGFLYRVLCGSGGEGDGH